MCYEEKAEESNREGTVGETQGVCVILFYFFQLLQKKIVIVL